MKQCSLTVRKLCLIMPAFLCSAILLAALFVNLAAAIGQTQQVLNVYRTENQAQGIQFPYAIEGTPLIAERTAVYDGPYVEDGSNVEVTGITALVLRNQGAQMIERTEVTLTQGTRRLVFRAETIPPGAIVLVLETNQSPYRIETCYACHGYAVLAQKTQVPPCNIWIVESGMNDITIQNMTDTVITGLELQHKGWLEEPGIYIGGVTHKTQVGTLAPGESIQVTPEFYAAGYSKILRITAE